MTVTPEQIRDLKLEALADLYREGRITRAECFKHEVAISLGNDAGPIRLSHTVIMSDGTEREAL